MRIDRLFVMLTLVAMLSASTGCARWTLWPQSAATGPQDGAQAAAAKPKGPSSLLQAVGLDRSAQQRQQDVIATKKQQEQQANDDLKHLDPALALARLAERQGEPSEARRQYRRYIDKNPAHPLPHHRLGVMAARESKFEEAEAHLQRAAQMGRPSAELLSDLGYLYFLQHRLPEAEHLLQQAKQLEPSNQTVNNNLAKVMAAKGDYGNTLRHYRKANEEAEARANLAYTYSQQGDLERARQEYLRALTLDNTLTSAAKALVQIEEARKREQAAISKMQAALGDELIDGQAQAHAAQAPPMRHRNIAPPREVMQAQAATNSYPATPNRMPVAAAGHIAAPQPLAQHAILMQVPPPNDAMESAAAPHSYEAPASNAAPAAREGVQMASHTEPATASLSSPSFTREHVADGPASGSSTYDWHNAWQDLSKNTTTPAAQQPQVVQTPPARADAVEMEGYPRSRFTASAASAQDGAHAGLSDENAPPTANTTNDSGGVSISIGDK